MRLGVCGAQHVANHVFHGATRRVKPNDRAIAQWHGNCSGETKSQAERPTWSAIQDKI